MEKNIITHQYKLTRKERIIRNKHNSFLIFFTGLSGSGKSTIANALEQKLYNEGINTYVLDGDNVRKGINKDLTFDPEDRSENIRRIAEIANLMIDAGLVVLAAFVAPYKKDREMVEKVVNSDNFVEVFVNTDISVCESRDVKGLYKKARAGEIPNMTGVDAPYEAPERPDVEVTDNDSIEESVEKIYKTIIDKLQLKTK
ncbi:MAG: adenylyl-sulfate kinase [Galbibacter orientalis]|uniref:adenylyl-sulfate kinase n=1 Tax=Galbibacter orientalis TaxID=453852 RepID=UPI00300350E7